MNVRQLEAFHAVMETGSMTLAGERLGVSQPAISKLLKSLSESCGFQLFHRSAGRMVPTLEARLLSVEVERMFAGTGRVASVARAIRNREIGHVTLAAFPALCARYLPSLLSPFIRQQPDLHLVLRSKSSYQIADLVAARQIDLGLSLMPYDDPAVRSEIVASFSMVCFLPRAHPLAEKNVIEIADLKDESFVALERDDCSIMTIDRAFQASGIQKRTRIEVPMSEAACGFVANGAGVSILPPFIGLDIDDGSIVRRPLLPDTAMDIWLIQPQQARNSLAAEMMAGYLRDALANPGSARPAA